MLKAALSRTGRATLSLSRGVSSSSATPATVASTHANVAVRSAPQSPNKPAPWSTAQRPRSDAYAEARFEQTNIELQPTPLSAMEMIANEPIRLVEGRKAVCDGGIGPLGHPKIFINLDKPGPHACGYCGIRFEKAPHHGHEH